MAKDSLKRQNMAMPRPRKKISRMNLLHLRGPVMVGDVVYPPGGAFGPRYQRDFQLVVIHAGELNLRQDDRKMHLRAGDGILLSPGHREVFAFARERETRHSWCTLQARAVPRELRPHFSGMNQPVPFAGRMNILLEWSRATVDQEESPLAGRPVPRVGFGAFFANLRWRRARWESGVAAATHCSGWPALSARPMVSLFLSPILRAGRESRRSTS